MEVKKVKFNLMGYLLIIIIILTAVIMYMRETKKEKGHIYDVAENETRPSLEINDKKIWIALADTPEKRTLGLSGRTYLEENEGMFFIFDSPQRRSFWMKDMNFPIDIIWIDAEFKIVDISKNVLPESFPNTFQPRFPAQHVLEVNGGWAEKNNVKIGDSVEYAAN